MPASFHLGRIFGRFRVLPRRLRHGPRPVPHVPVEASVTPNYLICLETGARLVCLGRHIEQKLGMTQQEYRKKWGLPSEYPMVAAIYRQMKEQSLAQKDRAT
ncbi:hypothetical protein EKE94_16020 [Mesobaculum littorinae]|uniref:Transcriptional regulator n=1 Tax=Mesobaculum littorinae TaxID=2486419 RepID=A0A438ADY6_9RHOB|nr:MucR family transcriptional regulator [Mesobaculum littorinae]RVV96852.1 hypothetical protein EKE94_16020 [Mesobaculum littorinae]